MNIEKTEWTKRFDFAMLSAWILLSLVLALISFLWFGVDFRGYYAAALVFLAGGNPYDYRQVAQVLLEVTGEMGNNPYYYPPWFAWLFIPLVPLPFPIARTVWMAFNLLLWMMGLWQLGKVIEWPPKGWQRYVLFTLTTFSFAWITWRYEQAGILVFVILVALIYSLQKQNWTASGIWLAMLLIKPNITLIVVAGVSLWLIRKGHWRPIWVMLITVLILLSISTIITPEWFRPLLEDGFGRGLTVVLDGPDQVVALRINTTFSDWLRTFSITSQWHNIMYGIVICLGVLAFLWTIARSQSLLELISILLLVSYMVTPYALQYDFPPLAIPVFWALSQCASSRKSFTVASVLAAFVFSVIFWQQDISWAYWMVVGSVALAVWAMVHEKYHLHQHNGRESLIAQNR